MHPHFRKTAVAAAIILAMPALAQTPASPIDQGVVVVTADRFGAPAADLPLGVTIITGAEIANSTAENIQEALAKLGGVHIRNSAGDPNASIDLRGFGMSGDQNTLILLDGQRISENELAAARLTAIPLNAIDHIEILRGSGAVLYGAGASAGAINIVTRGARAGRGELGLSAAAGTYATTDLRLDASASGDATAVTVHAGSLASDNYRRNNRVTDDSAEGDMRLKFASGDVGIKFGSSRERLGMPGYRSELQLVADPSGTDHPDDHGTTAIWHAGITGKGAFGAAELAAELDFRNKKANTDLFSAFGNYSIAANTDRWTFSPRLRVAHDGPGGASELVAGLDWQDWTYTQQNTYGAAAASQRSTAVYVQELLALTATTELSLGGRLQHQRDHLTLPADGERSIGLSAFELGLRQAFAERWAAYGKWGQSFRTATVDENYNAFTDTVSLLAPQKSHDTELGLQCGHGPNRLRAAWFQSNIINEIHFLVVPGTSDFAFGANTNLSPSRRSGIELEGQSQLDQFDLSANLSHTVAEYRSGTYGGVDLSGKEVPLVPRVVAALNATWHVAPARELAATWRHVGEQRYDNDQVNAFRMMPSYDLADLKYRHDLKSWSWSLAIDNAFDKRYYSYAIRNGAGTTFSAYPELGRRVMAQVDFRL